jgi:hypothetical protein
MVVPVDEMEVENTDSYPDLFRTINSSTHQSIKLVNEKNVKKQPGKKK